MVNKIKELVLSKFTGVKLNLIYGRLYRKEKQKIGMVKINIILILKLKSIGVNERSRYCYFSRGQTLYELADWNSSYRDMYCRQPVKNLKGLADMDF